MTFEHSASKAFHSPAPSGLSKPVALCWLSQSLHSLLFVNAVCSFRGRAFFSTPSHCFLPRMISCFFPAKPNGSHLSSTRSTTHPSTKPSLMALAHWVPSSRTFLVLRIKVLFSGCSVQWKCCQGFPNSALRTSIDWNCETGLSLSPDHSPMGCCYYWSEGKADSVARSWKWITICRKLCICFIHKRLTSMCGIFLENTWQKARRTIKQLVTSS